MISSKSEAISAPLSLATIVNNLGLFTSKLIPLMTSEVSAIWGITFLDTKLPISIVSKPTFNNLLM